MPEAEKSWLQMQLYTVSRRFMLGAHYIPMPLLFVVLNFSSIGSGVSGLIVEVDVDRPLSEFFRGPKWVSLNSVQL